jgi:hypothetical protein
MTGRIRSARAAASLALRPDPAVQPPSFAPRRLAAARPALVRCEMSAPLLLRQRGEQVEDEGVNFDAKLRNDERHAVDHQARNQMHVTGEPVELSTITGPPSFRAALIAEASCGRRSGQQRNGC